MTAITKFETIRIALPFETGGPRSAIRPGMAEAPWLKMECLMLRLESEDGQVGWGEAFGHHVVPGTDAILNQMIAPMLMGKDSRAIDKRVEEMERPFHGFGRNGPVRYALSAVDIALWDMAAKRAGMPLFRMLGGESGELMRYASLMRYGGDPTAVAANTARARAAGFTTIKLHENTVTAFRAALDAVDGQSMICLDVNCPWTVGEAKAIAREIRGDGFHWLEEPVWPPENYAGIAEVRAEGVPIAAGENFGTLFEYKAALDAGAVDILQVSVVKAGGISGMQRIFALARAYPVRVIPHCFYWGPGYNATAHLAAARTEPTLVETAFIDFAVQPHKLFDVSTAHFTLPETPGLGFEADWDALEPYVVSRSEHKA